MDLPAGGIVTPDARSLTEGEASTAELHALLRGSALDARSAAVAAQAAAEAAQAAAESPTTMTALRSHRSISPSQRIDGLTIHAVPPSMNGQLVEHAAAAFTNGATATIATDLLAIVFVAPAGSVIPAQGGPPSDWVLADAAATPSPAGFFSLAVFDPATPYYVPPGQQFLILTAPGAEFASAQWVNL